MREILPGKLWTGHAHDIRPLDVATFATSAIVVDLALNESPAALAREVTYLRIPINDSAANLRGQLQLAVLCTLNSLGSQFPTLVCCSAGLSRSPAVACVAVAMWRGQDPDEVLRTYVEEVPHDVSPALWKELLGVYHSLR